MGRGLDGFFPSDSIPVCGLFSFEGPWELSTLPVVMARGKHLFPFRTEQLSPSAPMVLGPHGPGRVGRRRFIYDEPSLGGGSSWFWGAPRRRTRP
jgi:hypothetical protein